MNELDVVEVLLVEDNPHDAEMTIRALTKGNFGHKLHWVKDGVEALDFIHCTGAYAGRHPEHQLRLVLLDLKMPRLNGLDVLRNLKTDPVTNTIPVVVMTSSNEDRDVLESHELGVNGYVQKPVQYQLFMEAVTQIGEYWLSLNQSPGR
jgi:two-component system response regulator